MEFLFFTIICNDSNKLVNVILCLQVLYECTQNADLSNKELLGYTMSMYYRTFSECTDAKFFQKYSLELIKAEFVNFDLDICNQCHSCLKRNYRSLNRFFKYWISLCLVLPVATTVRSLCKYKYLSFICNYGR